MNPFSNYRWFRQAYPKRSCIPRCLGSQSLCRQHCFPGAVSRWPWPQSDRGRSYVVGFGKNAPQRPHHRSSSCPSAPACCDWGNYHNSGPNAHVLYGALVGGPDRYDNFKDDRTEVKYSEVTTDYNVGFQSAVAGLRHLKSVSCLFRLLSFYGPWCCLDFLESSSCCLASMSFTRTSNSLCLYKSFDKTFL